jgi:dTDP-glucose pyrophosphorylase
MNVSENSLISPNATINEAIKSIELSETKIALVVDDERRLLGTITDGDVRRGILRRFSLDDTVGNIMNSSPKSMSADESREDILSAMRDNSYRHMPIVDPDGRVVSVVSLTALLRAQEKENWVVLMAGGLGKRLMPLTEDMPKPLLTVGDKPILETILENFISAGFKRFYISVNYKGEMIEQYFGDGADRGIEILYLREYQALGTAGALSLIPEQPEHPVVVMNGDILTNIDLEHLLEFHVAHETSATMCVRTYDVQVPYGVVEFNGQSISKIIEKPVHQFFVNAGIYVLEPQTLALIPKDSPYDMPNLLELLMEGGKRVLPFPIREQWLDIGQREDFSLAQSVFADMFK